MYLFLEIFGKNFLKNNFFGIFFENTLFPIVKKSLKKAWKKGEFTKISKIAKKMGRLKNGFKKEDGVYIGPTVSNGKLKVFF